MADFGNVTAYLNGISDDALKRIFGQVFEYVLRDIRFGRGLDAEAAKNFGGGFFKATTPAVANTEFSIAHNFGHKPYLIVPVLPLDQVNAQIVRLKVARAADANRIYLSSPDTSATVFVYVEG